MKLSSKPSGYLSTITFTTCTKDTVRTSQSACMENYEEETRIRSGYKNVCVHVSFPPMWPYSFVVIIHADTKSSEKLTTLLTNASLTKDIGRLCPSYQTSSLESYHSVVNHFAPKSTAFSYLGMECRYMYITCVRILCYIQDIIHLLLLPP